MPATKEKTRRKRRRIKAKRQRHLKQGRTPWKK
jgi:hypothetical protein